MWNFKRNLLVASSALWMAGTLAAAPTGLGNLAAVKPAVCVTCNEQAKRGASVEVQGINVAGLMNRLQSSALQLGTAPKPKEGVKYLTGQSDLPNALAPQPIPNLNEMEVSFTTPYYSNTEGYIDSPEAPWNRVFPAALANAFNNIALGASPLSVGLATPSFQAPSLAGLGLGRTIPLGPTFSNPRLIQL